MSYRIEESVTINAPREYVWEVVQSIERRLEWDARVVSVRKLTPGPIGKGSQTEVVTKMYGFEFPTVIEFVSWNPPMRSGVKAVKMTKGSESIVASWQFDENPDGSTTWTTTIVMKESPDVVGSILKRFLPQAFEALTRASQQNLKRLIEAEYPKVRRKEAA